MYFISRWECSLPALWADQRLVNADTKIPASTATSLQIAGATSLALSWANVVPLGLDSFWYIYQHNQVVFGFPNSPQYWPTVLALARRLEQPYSLTLLGLHFGQSGCHLLGGKGEKRVGGEIENRQ